jgi:hypothetical protein
MSGRHATIAAWHRHEDGAYSAEIEGWNLRVAWKPEGDVLHPGKHGFAWTAERGGTEVIGEDIFEEMEVAMADAEHRTAPAAVLPGDPAAHPRTPTSEAHPEH